MKIIYDAKTDSLNLFFSNSKIHESDEEKEGFIMDFDKKGNPVSIEILDASTRVPDFMAMNFEVRGLVS